MIRTARALAACPLLLAGTAQAATAVDTGVGINFLVSLRQVDSARTD